MDTTTSRDTQETPPPVAPFGYVLPKAGINNGYYFHTPEEFTHVEERFRHIYTPVYDQPSDEIARLKRSIEGLETLRPVWAHGHGEASMIAQAATTALAGLWQMLGADHQTEAVQKLRDLLARK